MGGGRTTHPHETQDRHTTPSLHVLARARPAPALSIPVRPGWARFDFRNASIASASGVDSGIHVGSVGALSIGGASSPPPPR